MQYRLPPYMTAGGSRENETIFDFTK